MVCLSEKVLWCLIFYILEPWYVSASFLLSEATPLPIILFIWLLLTETEKGERATVNGKRGPGTGNLKSGSNPENWKIGFSEISAVALSFPSFPCVKSSSLWTALFVSGSKKDVSDGVSFSFEQGIRFSGLFFSRGVLVFNCQDWHIIIY